MTTPCATRPAATQPALLLAAAARLREPFTLAELAVTAWRASPAVFGLKGYADKFPDSNRVSAALSHVGGPVRKGLLEKVGPGLYRLTRAGLEAVHGAEGV